MNAKVLSPTELQLLSLITSERAGREVARLYEGEAGQAISYGTLYTTLRRMRERGWVGMREDRELDRRIRLFVATMDGVHELDSARGHYASLSRFGQEVGHA